MRTILRTMLFLLAVAVGGCTADRQGLISGDEFAELYADALRRSAPELNVRIAGPLEISVEREDGRFTAFLDNAYANYQASPEHLQDIIADYVGGVLASERSASAVLEASRIVPVIKSWTYLDTFRQAQGNDLPLPESPAYDRYNDDLIVLYAEDSPRSLRFLYEDELRDAGIPRDGFRELAVENLRRLLPGISALQSERSYALVADNVYESSLLLFDDLWNSDAWTSGIMDLAGDPVIAVPTRNIVIVTGSQEPGGLALLQDLASRIAANEPYAITSQLFIYRGGRFQPFDG